MFFFLFTLQKVTAFSVHFKVYHRSQTCTIRTVFREREKKVKLKGTIGRVQLIGSLHYFQFYDLRPKAIQLTVAFLALSLSRMIDVKRENI